MAKKRMGRPPKAAAEQQSEIVAVRLTPAERQQCEAAAEKAGGRLSDWIRERLLRAAKREARQN